MAAGWSGGPERVTLRFTSTLYEQRQKLRAKMNKSGRKKPACEQVETLGRTDTQNYRRRTPACEERGGNHGNSSMMGPTPALQVGEHIFTRFWMDANHGVPC